MSTFLYGASIRANGIRQHFLRYGGERPGRDSIILIPGITSPAITWGFVGERFGAIFDTYVIDVRGRGLSEASSDLDYSLDAQADDVIALAQALGLARYAIIGHSMGGRIAVRAAARQPAGLARIVMIDPPVSGPGRRPYPAKFDWYIDSLRLSRAGADVETMRPFCPTWTDEQLRLRAEWLHTCDERAVRTSFDGFHTDDIHADMSRVCVPALLIVAGRGDVVRTQDIEEIRTLIPDLQVATVPNAGHMIPWDDEPGFYASFGTFLGARLNA